MDRLTTYEPINRLKTVAEDVYLVDGPVIGMSYMGLAVPFTTRMTIVRLPDGRLWIHSPTPLVDALEAEIAALGEPAFLIAPNRLHFWWIGEWKARFPRARAYAAPGARKAAAARFSAFDADLSHDPPPEWGGAFAQYLLPGLFLTEVDFLHRASGTLILADLIENFESSHIGCAGWRFLAKLGGPLDPDGKPPHDLALNFLWRKKEARAEIERMLGDSPQRIILSHGRWYDRDAAAELRRALRRFLA
ncbi:DUF4336 domain-containing protein [Methylosinus sp. Sm6]|uniref:DUF4336 domain-containing protein n=1 Tax=Methylosinus sp. Sm6 TaxID=2866948 RepID=UPI001C99AF5D|nr:DUF4336 domain-containing protein [Methylosinus sp. Sm6]MBY6240646.1 DUF4336 domain-containing protein [Methylosinus sp. Sm6]